MLRECAPSRFGSAPVHWPRWRLPHLAPTSLRLQLAMALDRAGKRADARPLWEKVLQMAEGYKDQTTVDAARARLAQKP